MKRTKIVCTIGPACDSVEVLVKMIAAGMNVARLNFSHGSHENHTQLFNNVREAARQAGEPVAILQDLQGPKIRVGVLPEAGVALSPGAQIVFDTALSEYAGEAIPVDYHELHQYLKAGERLLLNDGKMETEIVAVEGTRITTLIKVGGTLTSHKGINVPDSTLTVRAMSDKDKDDARFGLSLGVDFIALSFVRNAQDILDLRALLDEEAKAKNISQNPPIKIIAKIERREAVENIESIMEVVRCHYGSTRRSRS
jgi:pyruvate kinase